MASLRKRIASSEKSKIGPLRGSRPSQRKNPYGFFFCAFMLILLFKGHKERILTDSFEPLKAARLPAIGDRGQLRKDFD